MESGRHQTDGEVQNGRKGFASVLKDVRVGRHGQDCVRVRSRGSWAKGVMKVQRCYAIGEIWIAREAWDGKGSLDALRRWVGLKIETLRMHSHENRGSLAGGKKEDRKGRGGCL